MTNKMWNWAFVLFITAWVWTIHSEVWSMSEEVAVMEYPLTKIHEKLDWHTEKLEIIQGSQYEILKQIDGLKEE